MANKPNPATPHKIFRAASELFAKNSYEAVSVKDIAEAGNINSALISYYFGGKAKLYQAVLLKQADIFLNTIAKFPGSSFLPWKKSAGSWTKKRNYNLRIAITFILFTGKCFLPPAWVKKLSNNTYSRSKII